ncbi:hypothetical protein D3C84_1101370 [compost metagenome]
MPPPRSTFSNVSHAPPTEARFAISADAPAFSAATYILFAFALIEIKSRVGLPFHLNVITEFAGTL